MAHPRWSTRCEWDPWAVTWSATHDRVLSPDSQRDEPTAKGIAVFSSFVKLAKKDGRKEGAQPGIDSERMCDTSRPDTLPWTPGAWCASLQGCCRGTWNSCTVFPEIDVLIAFVCWWQDSIFVTTRCNQSVKSICLDGYLLYLLTYSQAPELCRKRCEPPHPNTCTHN